MQFKQWVLREETNPENGGIIPFGQHVLHYDNEDNNLMSVKAAGLIGIKVDSGPSPAR